MPFAEMIAYLPLILVAATAVAVMLGIAWRVIPVHTTLLDFDGLALLAGLLILGSTLACAILSHAYLESFHGAREEFYVLLLCAAAGGLVLAASRHLASLFIGLAWRCSMLKPVIYGSMF